MAERVPVSDTTKTNVAKLILVEGIMGKPPDSCNRLAVSELMTALDREPGEKEQRLPAMKLFRDLDIDYGLLGKATSLTRLMQIRVADLALGEFSEDPHVLVDAVALMTLLENSDDKMVAHEITKSLSSERYEKLLASLLASKTITPEQAVGLTSMETLRPPPTAGETVVPQQHGSTIPCIPSFSDSPVSDSGLHLKEDKKKASNQ